MLLLSKFKISGHSMDPYIKDEDKVLASGIFYLFKSPKINDIVAIKHKESFLIKRISKINDNKFFVRGDNEKDSLDSRKFGFISRQDILGKVFYKF